MEKTCGFCILRKPEFNSDLKIRPSLPNGVVYRGVDRLPWEEISVDYYAKKLPVEIGRLWKEIVSYNGDISGLVLCKDLAIARQLLQYSGGVRNEICSIISPKLAELKGTIEIEHRTLPIGSDVVSIGNWSLIAGGVLKLQNFYDQWASKLNASCLLDNSALAHSLEHDYDHWSQTNPAVEEMIKEPFGIEAISIGIIE